MYCTILLLVILASIPFILSSYKIKEYLFLKKLGWKYHSSFRSTSGKAQLPVVKVLIGDNPYYLVIDSGATSNILDEKFYNSVLNADFMKVSTIKHRIAGINNNKDTALTAHKKVELTFKFTNGNKASNQLDCIVADLRSPFSVLEPGLEFPVAGLVGVEFLKQYGWILDFEKQVIWQKVK